MEKTPKPSEWKADEVKKFSNNILGDETMQDKLIVRQCYTEMRAQIMNWLNDKFKPQKPRTGMFVITGTPGIGKSVFLAYMVAFLVEKGYGIVIQRGQKFWSRQSESPYLNKQPTNTKKTLDWVKGAKKPCSCSKNHAHVSFRFFEGGSAIASQDKRLNHLFSTLGTMTMTQKVSAQSVPCHLLLKKKVCCIPSIKFEPRTTVPTNICNYFGKNNLHAIKDERERLHHINRVCYCHPLIAFTSLSNCHPLIPFTSLSNCHPLIAFSELSNCHPLIATPRQLVISLVF